MDDWKVVTRKKNKKNEVVKTEKKEKEGEVCNFCKKVIFNFGFFYKVECVNGQTYMTHGKCIYYFFYNYCEYFMSNLNIDWIFSSNGDIDTLIKSLLNEETQKKLIILFNQLVCMPCLQENLNEDEIYPVKSIQDRQNNDVYDFLYKKYLLIFTQNLYKICEKYLDKVDSNLNSNLDKKLYRYVFCKLMTIYWKHFLKKSKDLYSENSENYKLLIAIEYDIFDKLYSSENKSKYNEQFNKLMVEKYSDFQITNENINLISLR